MWLLFIYILDRETTFTYNFGSTIANLDVLLAVAFVFIELFSPVDKRLIRQFNLRHVSFYVKNIKVF